MTVKRLIRLKGTKEIWWVNHNYRHRIVNEQTFAYGRDVARLWGSLNEVEDVSKGEFREYDEATVIRLK